MTTIAIPSLTEVTSIDGGDDFVVETSTGTRRVSRNNLLPVRADITILTANDIVEESDLVALWDNTDGKLKGITFFNAIFGNVQSVSKLDGFTLTPSTDNRRPIECRGTFTTKTITLDSNTTDIGGATFFIHNLSADDLTLTKAGTYTLHRNGVVVTEAVIRENTWAVVQMNNAGDEAVVVADDTVRSINAQTGTSYTIVLADLRQVVTMDNAAANTLTIPANSTTAFPIGTQIDIIQLGAGTTTIDAAVGVTLNGVSGGSGDISARYGPATILKIATDTWVVFGNIGAVA